MSYANVYLLPFEGDTYYFVKYVDHEAVAYELTEAKVLLRRAWSYLLPLAPELEHDVRAFLTVEPSIVGDAQ